MKTNKKTQGKKNREAGARFERKVRKDLTEKGWIVDRWTNTVIWSERYCGLAPAKSRFNMRTTGFPDFIAFRDRILSNYEKELPKILFEVIGVEVKSNGYLTKEEKEKCKWLLDNNVFSKILIASKGKKKGEIVYKNFKTMKIKKEE